MHNHKNNFKRNIGCSTINFLILKANVRMMMATVQFITLTTTTPLACFTLSLNQLKSQMNIKAFHVVYHND
jgi:hypothetical protein